MMQSTRSAIIWQVIALLAVCCLLPAAAQLPRLNVHVVTNSDPSVNPFSGMALRGCTDLAANVTENVGCRTSILDGSTSLSVMLDAWKALIEGNAQDEVFVAASWSFGQVMQPLTALYPNKVFSIIDYALPNSESSPIPVNAIGVVFAEDQASYLAGALAATFTSTRRVGVIGGIPLPPVKRLVYAYLQGVLSVCSSCEVYYNFNPSFGSAPMGIAAADELISHGADVLFAAGGFTSSAGILHGAGRGAWVIGVDTDERQTTFLNRSESSRLLSSALKRADTAVKTVIQYVRRGQRGGYNLLLDVSLDGVGLAELVSTSARNFSTEVSVSLQTSGEACATTTFSSRSSVINWIRSSLQRRLIRTGVSPVTGDFVSLATPSNKTWYDLVPFGERAHVSSNMQGQWAVHVGGNNIVMWGGQTAFGEFPQHVLQLDFDAFTWSRIADGGSQTIPAGRMFHAMSFDSVTKSMFVFGGQKHIVNGDAAASILGDTWVYDIESKRWSPVSSNGNNAPSARANMAHASLDRWMYVYGGTSATGLLLGDLWAFNMESKSWTKLNPSGTAPPLLQHATMSAVNGTSIVLYGGTRDNGEYSNSLYVLDLTSMSWTLQRPSTLVSGPPPAAERVRSVSVDARRVLFTGGLTAQRALNSTWVWHMDENKWSQSSYGSLNGGLHSHALVAFNQSAYAKACQFLVGSSNFPICTPQTVNAVVALSGVSSKPSGGLKVSFAHPDPPPPRPGSIDSGAKWAVTVINALGLLLACSLMAFVGLNWKHKVIKSSNPPFCLIILFGAILAHIGLVASTWETDDRRGIMLTAFLLAGGYTLIFAALDAKTYLVYAIFQSKRIQKRNMLKYYLATLGAFAAQMLVSGLWFVFDDLPLATMSVGGSVWVVRIKDQNWLMIVSAPVVLLTLLGVFLAYRTKNVTSRFNEGQYVGVATYSIAMTLFVVGPVMLLLDSPLVQYVIVATLTSVTTGVVQLVFFGHKVVAVFFPSSTTEIEVTDSSVASSGGTSVVSASAVLRCKYCKSPLVNGGSESGVSGLGTGSSMSASQYANASAVKILKPPSASMFLTPSSKSQSGAK